MCSFVYEGNWLIIVQDLDYFKDCGFKSKMGKTIGRLWREGNDMIWSVFYKASLFKISKEHKSGKKESLTGVCILCPVGQIQPPAWSWIACELRMVFIFCNGWGYNQKKNISRNVKITWKSDFIVHWALLKHSHTYSFTYCLWLSCTSVAELSN